ncbi:hypothetical protein GWK47_036731 [Chionoecetes opilio]|uniref:Uncharacterized protein n=1 Tax=Chionoecetes opilio TaxID=41210 RepID=A0A8J4YR72_CHIOP|nr:hypothetical protein GWK47_036731 [Chionoecetes opilio]
MLTQGFGGEGFKISPKAPLRLSWAERGSWFSAGPLPSRPFFPRLAPPPLPRSLSRRDVLTGSKICGPFSPYQNRDSQVRGLAGWVCGSYGWSGVSWAFPTLTSCASGVVGLDDFSELLHGKNGGPLKFCVPFSDAEASQVPIACLPLTGASFCVCGSRG